MIRPAVPLLLTLALSLAACGKTDVKPEEVRPVRTQTVVGGLVTGDAVYSGEVRARLESKLGFRIGGKVVERYIELGQSVRAGQPLLRLDSQDAALNVNAVTAQQTAAQADFQQSRLDLERAKELQAKNFVSQAEVDRRQTAFNAAQARLNQAEAQLKVAGNQRGYNVLIADRAGIITAVDVEIGQVVAAGQPVVKLAADGEREVLVSVPESRVEELRQAKELKVALWALPGVGYHGQLRELAPDTDPITRTYAARVRILNPDSKLRLGMTASVALATGSSRAVRLPLTAIYDQTGQPQVWLVDGKTMTVQLKPVKLAGVQDNQVIVVSGLQEGQQVVTAGVHLLHAGQKVRPEASQLATDKPATVADSKKGQ